ncbi:MAG TPA: MFS transporter [Terriglobales bacterium]|nr:MFS transporter [Terriglobales bacterium]
MKFRSLAGMEPAPELEVSAVTFASYARLLSGNRNFRRLWSAQVVSELGDWFYTLAIYNLLLQLTGRAGSVALALVLQVLPQAVIGPTAGVVNDRLRRKHVMIASDIGRMLIVLCMLLIRTRDKVWLVYPLLMAETLLVAFFEPARNAGVPNLVKPEDVVVANTLSSTTWSVNLMVGATLGGVVAALLGRDAVFVLNALSFLVSAALIGGMHFSEPHAEGGHPFRARELVDFSPILAGIRYVRSQVRLRSTILVKFGNLVIGPGWVLFTVMGQNEFAVRWRGMAPERGAFLGMSLLLGARGLGALLGPILTASWAGHWRHRLEVAIFWGYLAAAAGYALLGISGHLWEACLCVVLAHFGSSIIWVFSTTLLQMQSDDKFRGRVFAADVSLFTITIAAGAYLAGRFVDWGFAARHVASVAGLLMLIPAALWGLAMRKNRGIG